MHAYRDSPTNTQWLFKNINKIIISEIRSNDLNVDQNVECSSLKSFKLVGSYNWSPESTVANPIVMIPGKSGILSKNLNPQKLAKSRHEQMVDENRFYMPDYPMEPLFRSVLLCTPDYDFKSLNFVTDRNGLRKLLNFVEDKAKDSFRIDFKRVGNFIVFIRNEENSTQVCDDYGKQLLGRLFFLILKSTNV